MRQIRNCLTRYSSPYWCSVPNIKKLACVVPEKNVTEIILWQIFRYQKYSKFRQTGSGHAADSKLSYMIQFSILMLCAKYQEAGLCGSWEKCDRNYFVTQTPDSDPYMSPVRNAGDIITFIRYVQSRKVGKTNNFKALRPSKPKGLKWLKRRIHDCSIHVATDSIFQIHCLTRHDKQFSFPDHFSWLFKGWHRAYIYIMYDDNI